MQRMRSATLRFVRGGANGLRRAAFAVFVARPGRPGPTAGIARTTWFYRERVDDDTDGKAGNHTHTDPADVHRDIARRADVVSDSARGLPVPTGEHERWQYACCVVIQSTPHARALQHARYAQGATCLPAHQRCGPIFGYGSHLLYHLGGYLRLA